MISNLIRSLSTRSLITLSINLHRGQLLKRHSSINRLLSILHSDINRGGTTTTLSSSELSLTITQLSLAILGHQRRIQVVLLTSNQTLIGHSVSNNRTIDNTLLRTLRKLSLSLNRRILGRRLFRSFGGRSLGTWDRNIWRLMSTATIRQSRLIRRHHTLTVRVTPQLSVGAHNCNVSACRSLRDVNRRIAHEFNIEAVATPRGIDVQARQLLKLFGTSPVFLKGWVPLLVVRVVILVVITSNSERCSLLILCSRSKQS